MSVEDYDSRGRHKLCGAIVENIEGRRLTRERLAAIHDESCPAVMRLSSQRRKAGRRGDRDASSDDE